MSQPDDWKIPTSDDTCAECSATLAVHSLVTVTLRLEGEGPARRDLCEVCGKKVEAGGELIFWRHRRSEQEERRPVVDYAMLREVFERMLQREEEVYRRLCYLVGLVLVRKRQLRLRRFEVQDGREVMIVSRSVDAPELVVPAPFLSAEDMVATREALTRLLATDLTEGELDLSVTIGSEAARKPAATEAGEQQDGTEGQGGSRTGEGAPAEQSEPLEDFMGPRPELN